MIAKTRPGARVVCLPIHRSPVIGLMNRPTDTLPCTRYGIRVNKHHLAPTYECAYVDYKCFQQLCQNFGIDVSTTSATLSALPSPGTRKFLDAKRTIRLQRMVQDSCGSLLIQIKRHSRATLRLWRNLALQSLSREVTAPSRQPTIKPTTTEGGPSR